MFAYLYYWFISYKLRSVGLTAELLTNEASSLRLAAIHVRGLEDMSTDDIMQHFAAYAPSFIEWIDDTSCNVVWHDEMYAARALHALSNPVSDEAPASQSVSETAADEQPVEGHMETEVPQSEVSQISGNEKIVADGDPSEAKALSDGEVEDETEGVLKSMGVAKMYADREPGEMAPDDDDDAFAGSGPKRKREDTEGIDFAIRKLVEGLKWRVGQWPGRKGLKGRKLFMRFATICKHSLTLNIEQLIDEILQMIENKLVQTSTASTTKNTEIQITTVRLPCCWLL